MFYRRKLLLTLLKELNGVTGKTRLQKLLFLLCQTKDKPDYDFVPYKFGSFSFSANADLTALCRRGVVKEVHGQWKYSGESYLDLLITKDREQVLRVKKEYGKLSNAQLLEHCYKEFPYYAIFSEVKEKYLSKKDIRRIEEAVPVAKRNALFTIGYEGLSLESYLNKLIQNKVSLLIDVRRNPLSMKYGFSKGQLSYSCKSVNIQYLHMPEVGVESSKRQNLKTKKDYEILFKNYKSDVLKNTTQQQNEIIRLLQQKKRVALTCFEHDKDFCHRSHLADSLMMSSSIKQRVDL